MVGHYMGRVRNIIKIDVSFNGDAIMDATIDVNSQTMIDCSSESIFETDVRGADSCQNAQGGGRHDEAHGSIQG